jgi:flagellar hook assembly protein FlgD
MREMTPLILVVMTAAIAMHGRAAAGDRELGSHHVHPNPFTDKTTFDLSLPKPANIRISVYDISGRLVRTLFDGPHKEGDYPIDWDGKDVSGNPIPAGVYICVLFLEGRPVSSTKVIKINP